MSASPIIIIISQQFMTSTNRLFSQNYIIAQIWNSPDDIFRDLHRPTLFGEVTDVMFWNVNHIIM